MEGVSQEAISQAKEAISQAREGISQAKEETSQAKEATIQAKEAANTGAGHPRISITAVTGATTRAKVRSSV